MRTGGWALAAGLLLAGAASAAERPVLEEEIVVTATRFARDVARTGATMSVVTREEIEARQVRRVDDALRLVPGAFVSRGGGVGASSSLFLRGAGSNQTVVLVDGVQVNDPTVGGQFNFFDLGVENVERVEVLRGAASALYGSDALGGVVSVVTRRGEGPPSFRAETEGGSHGHFRTSLGASGSVRGLSYAAGVSRTRWGNELPRQDFLADTYSARLGVDLAENLRLAAVGRAVDSEAEEPYAFPFGARIPEDSNIRRQRNTGILGITLDCDASDEVSFRLAGSLYDANSLFTDGPDSRGAPVELESRAEAQVRTLSAVARLSPEDPAGWLALRGILGLEAEDEVSKNRVLTAFGRSPDLDRTVRNRAGFLLAEATLDDRLTLSGGLRRDRNSFFGFETTASGSALLRLAETGTSLRANYGEGFRAPKPVEFADPFVGNPELGPERSRSLDLGVAQEFAGGRVRGSVVWFEQRTRDLIAWDPGTGVLENLARARVRGVELEAAVRPADGWLVRGVVTLQDPRNESAAPGEEDRLPGRPRRFGGGEIRYAGPGFAAGLTVEASDDAPSTGRIAPDGEHRDHPGRRLLVGLLLSVEVAEGVRLTGRLENLLDDDGYDSEVGPRRNGRGITVGLAVDF